MKTKNYETLLAEKNELGEPMYYIDKLSTTEWKEKREVILNRDKQCCTSCKAVSSIFENGKAFRDRTKLERKEYIEKRSVEIEKFIQSMNMPELSKFMPQIGVPLIEEENPIFLHVHHKYYIKNKLPWEYSNEALITLCQNCHQAVHDSTEISVYLNEKMLTKLDLTKCKRCNGSGYLSKFHYYLNGICLRCEGNKYEEFLQ